MKSIIGLSTSSEKWLKQAELVDKFGGGAPPTAEHLLNRLISATMHNGVTTTRDIDVVELYPSGIGGYASTLPAGSKVYIVEYRRAKEWEKQTDRRLSIVLAEPGEATLYTVNPNDLLDNVSVFDNSGQIPAAKIDELRTKWSHDLQAERFPLDEPPTTRVSGVGRQALRGLGRVQREAIYEALIHGGSGPGGIARDHGITLADFTGDMEV